MDSTYRNMHGTKHTNRKTKTGYRNNGKQHTSATTKITEIIKIKILKYATQIMQIHRTVFCHFCMQH